MRTPFRVIFRPYYEAEMPEYIIIFYYGGRNHVKRSYEGN